ncbi:hypothetical protein FRC09_017547 [Ceratobasidium sp. 395]|nr:hypothetical protein FRC09_017547 [Ceratobasidium sp. 395]
MSIDAFRAAASCQTGHPFFRLEAAREWARLCTAYDISSLLDAYRQIMKLVPQVVWLGTTVQHRYRDISTLGDSVAEAIVTAIELENYDLALEWFEQGRAVVWKQTLHLRTPIDRLRDIAPKLSNRIEVVGKALDRAMYSKPTGLAMTKGISSEEQSAQKHRQLAREWENLIEGARNVLGDDNPFQPRNADWLMNAASSGPIIAINVHTDRCDALVLKPGCSRIAHVPLPSLSLDKLVDASQLLSLSLRRPGVRHSQKWSPVFYYPDSPHGSFSEVLKLLWLDIVEPIIEYLGYEPRSSVDELPRVTWCTAGPLAFLPLHAAGRYDETDSISKTYNYMISSYTPTISTLLSPTKPVSSFRGILTVGQANIGTAGALPATVDELDVISKYAKNLIMTRLDEEKATPTAVLEAIRSHSWVHLACHAEQNIDDPTKSCFQLHGGTLDLTKITEEPLKHAVFAFLSACQTATGHEDLPDEAVHLAAGMLMAGYQGVIATMWSINDRDAPVVADSVYSHLLEGGIPDSTRAAKALHIGVQSLRDKIGEENFVAWVPFIHMGL